jgi:hypothetical protein
MNWMENLIPEENRFDLEASSQELAFEPDPSYEGEEYGLSGQLRRPLLRGQVAGRPAPRPAAPTRPAPRTLPQGSPIPIGKGQEQRGEINFGWYVSGISAPGAVFAPVFFGGAGVLGEEVVNIMNAELFSAVVGKGVGSAGYTNYLASNRGAASTNIAASYSFLYPDNRPGASHLQRILSRHVCVIGRIRFTSTNTTYDTYIRSLALYLVEVNPLRQETVNTLIASSQFAPDQFQAGILDVDFVKTTGGPLVLTPERLLIIDITQNAVAAIPSDTRIMSVNFQNVLLKSLF